MANQKKKNKARRNGAPRQAAPRPEVDEDMTELPTPPAPPVEEPQKANGAAGDPLPPRADPPKQPPPQPQAPPTAQAAPQAQKINQTNMAIMQIVEMAKNDDLVGLGLVGLGRQGQVVQMVSSDRTPITDAVLYSYMIKQANKVQDTMVQREEDELRLAELDRQRQARERQRQAELQAAQEAVQNAGPAQ